MFNPAAHLSAPGRIQTTMPPPEQPTDLNHPTSTTNWRQYPKGPNFLGIVIGSGAILIVLLIAAYFFLHAESRKVMPHGPNPTPNSVLRLPSTETLDS